MLILVFEALDRYEEAYSDGRQMEYLWFWPLSSDLQDISDWALNKSVASCILIWHMLCMMTGIYLLDEPLDFSVSHKSQSHSRELLAGQDNRSVRSTIQVRVLVGLHSHITLGQLELGLPGQPDQEATTISFAVQTELP